MSDTTQTALTTTEFIAFADMTDEELLTDNIREVVASLIQEPEPELTLQELFQQADQIMANSIYKEVGSST